MGDDKTSRASKNDQEPPASPNQEPAPKNHPRSIAPTPLKNISPRGPAKEPLPSSSSLPPSKNSQAFETRLAGGSNEAASEISPTANSGQGRTLTQGVSIKPRTRSATARNREKPDLSGSSAQEPTQVAQNPRYPIRHKTRQTALASHSPTVGASSNPFLQNISPTRRRQKQIVRAKRANGEGGEPPEAEDTASGNGEKEGEETIKAPESRSDAEEPEKFLFTMKGPHEPGLKHLAAAIDPLPQAKGSHNQPTCQPAEDEANLSDRTIRPERRKSPGSDNTSQLGSRTDGNITSTLTPPSLQPIQNTADHNTSRGEGSNVDVSGRSSEYDAANLRPIIEALATPQPVEAHYASDHPEMNTPEQLLLNISQNPSPAMIDPQLRAIPVHQSQRYHYYTEIQYTVYIWASGPWPPSPTTRWNRFNVTSSSPVTLLFEYIGRNRPDTGLVEIGGGVIAHYLGDVRRYGTRMDQTGWPTTLCLRPSVWFSGSVLVATRSGKMFLEFSTPASMEVVWSLLVKITSFSDFSS
ncbi:hypothetical protein C7212DRAFT_363649 [Tuber magnatum]|uniref:Uncharacterized protein n=1 Tax=Tuber magnatum TaxID=42249 RepID=A0A317SRU7_9PEZI|nr:hypothetical protein C7212DRAFT_363649 [Tuber magnatum]